MKNNVVYKLLALLLAVLLWFYVTNQQNPIKDLAFSVPIEIKKIPDKLVVAEQTSSVTVRVSGRKQSLDKFSSKDIHAYLNLQYAKTGANKINVEVVVPKEIQVVGVSPPVGDVNLTKIFSKQVFVQLKIANQPPEGFNILAKSVTPDAVLVSGPQNILYRLSKAEIEVDLTNQKTNFVGTLPVRLYDEKGIDVSDWLKVKPDVSQAFVAISPSMPRKQVTIKPIYTGKLLGGSKIVRTVIEPAMVTVTGSETALNGFYVAETEAIDLRDQKATFTADVSLNLPQGVLAYPSTKVRVLVEIAK
jgi:YbbR domain-containing protein